MAGPSVAWSVVLVLRPLKESLGAVVVADCEEWCVAEEEDVVEEEDVLEEEDVVVDDETVASFVRRSLRLQLCETVASLLRQLLVPLM